MFGEETSESPRLPSPWRTLGRSSLESPSPLSLRTPASSSPSTPPLDLKHTPAPPAAAARSDHLELDFEFDVLTFKDEQDSPTSTSGGVGEEDGRKAISHRRGSGLDPEVDKSGHIEYKLRLNTPTPIRLAKLQTQLKWRLVEGGGMALYELGVLDDGTLVGLSFEDMTESLETLGKMLEGLGGGEIKVGKVVRLSGGKGTSAGEDMGGGTGMSFRPSYGYGAKMDLNIESMEEIVSWGDEGPLFPSFLVRNASHEGSPSPVLLPQTESEPSSSPQPHPQQQNHHRTPQERAAIKREKRDARRLRKEGGFGGGGSGGSLSTTPESSGTTTPAMIPTTSHTPPLAPKITSAIELPQPISVGRKSHPTPTNAKSPKLNPTATTMSPHSLTLTESSMGSLSTLSANSVSTSVECRKPRPAQEGEVRYVVEAVVLKRGYHSSRSRGKRRRAKSSTGEEEMVGVLSLGEEEEGNDEDEGEGSEEDEGGEAEGEGWKFLDFDWMQRGGKVVPPR